MGGLTSDEDRGASRHVTPPTRGLSADDSRDPLSPSGPSPFGPKLHLAGARRRAAIPGAASLPAFLGAEYRGQASFSEGGSGRAHCAAQATLRRRLFQPALGA